MLRSFEQRVQCDCFFLLLSVASEFFVVDFSLSLSPYCLLYISGYYADVKARCQVFRVCTNTDLSGRGSMNSLFIHIFIFIGFLSFRKQQHDKTTHNNIENSNKGAFASSISSEITAATKKNHFRFDMLAIRTLLINKKFTERFFRCRICIFMSQWHTFQSRGLCL